MALTLWMIKPHFTDGETGSGEGRRLCQVKSGLGFDPIQAVLPQARLHGSPSCRAGLALSQAAWAWG